MISDDREVFENNNVILTVDKFGEQNNMYYITCGLASIGFTGSELNDLFELLSEYANERPEEVSIHL